MLATTQTDNVYFALELLRDPTCCAIVRRIAHGPASVGDITDAVDARQPTVSRWLAKLRLIGMADFERVGKRNHYSLNRESIEGVQRFLGGLLDGEQ